MEKIHTWVRGLSNTALMHLNGLLNYKLYGLYTRYNNEANESIISHISVYWSYQP